MFMLLHSVCCDFSSNTDLEVTEEERNKGKEKSKNRNCHKISQEI